MKKILAITICAMMFLSSFAFAVSAQDRIYTMWEELAAYENFPYYNAYFNGKTPTIDGEVKADEYTAIIKLNDSNITHTKGGAIEGSIPDFINIYVHQNRENVYFAVEIQNDKAATMVFKDADGKNGEGWIDWRFTFDVSTSVTIERPHFVDGVNKYKNMNVRNRLDVDTTTSYCINDCSFGMFNFIAKPAADNKIISDCAAKIFTHDTDMSKNYASYEWVMPKADLITEFRCEGDTIEYINLGIWVNSIWYTMTDGDVWSAIPNSRVGWGYQITPELSSATDFVLPVSIPNYDIDDCNICVRLSKECPPPITVATTTTISNCIGLLTPNTTATTTEATTVATTTAAETTTGTAVYIGKSGCKGAIAISAIALLPALGAAFLVSKKKEE